MIIKKKNDESAQTYHVELSCYIDETPNSCY